jgi:aspartyl-tRNA(Asn)/glutamyl-tRNA(Gln) amidotransferase subunit A
MLYMDAMQSPLAQLRQAYQRGETTPLKVADTALAHANGSANRNTYIYLNEDAVRMHARMLSQKFPNSEAWPPLYGVPVSVKDCFDLYGTVTTAGSKYYARQYRKAPADSAMVERLYALGAMVIGKTHLHPLAYGITGENRDYLDSVQPRNAAWLTGGSSSGAAASVQEGSALAAIGTDTGGSIRVPAALCGLTGYRASHGIAEKLKLWRGAMHLAESFDTPGWLFQSAADAPLLGAAMFDLDIPEMVSMETRIGIVGRSFLHDCEPEVIMMYRQRLQQFAESGAELEEIEATFWAGAMEIFAPIQAAEAAATHRDDESMERGNFSHFPPEIAERLQRGEAMAAEELQVLRFSHAKFRLRMDAYFAQYDFLLLPCAPMATLPTGVDHSKTRSRILRYTIPFSLGGNPVVALPGDMGGLQLVAARGNDARLLRYAAQMEAKFQGPV